MILTKLLMFKAVLKLQLLSLHVNCQIRPTGGILPVRLQLLISPLGVWGAKGRWTSWGHAALAAWIVVVLMHAAVMHCSVFWVILPGFTCGVWGVCFNHIQSAELRLRFSHLSSGGVQRVHIQGSAPYGRTTSLHHLLHFLRYSYNFFLSSCNPKMFWERGFGVLRGPWAAVDSSAKHVG